MAKSGSRFFLWFIFLCIAAAAYLFWKRTNGGGTSNSFITTDEVCSLLHSDNDKRAEMMFRKDLGTPYITDNNTIRIYGLYNGRNTLIKFFSHKDFYYFIFKEEPDYKAFIEQFDNSDKLGESTNCSERYAITNECIIGEMKFREGMSCFVLIVMRSPDLDKSISQLPTCERSSL